MDTKLNSQTQDINFETWMLLTQTRRALFWARCKGLTPYNVSHRQASLIFMVQGLGDKAILSEVARLLFREPNTISELVKRLAEIGLIRKVSAKKGKNLVRIELTNYGKEIYEKSANEDVVQKYLSVLSDEEHYTLRAMLEKLWYHTLEELKMECSQPIPMSIRSRLATNRNWLTWIILAQTRRAMFKARSQGLAQFDITPRQAAMLFMIQVLGDRSIPSELARRLFLEPNSVSEVVDRMVKNGLVRRVNDLRKKNSVRIELTDRGRDIYVESVRQEPVHKIMAFLSNEEHKKLRAILHKLWGRVMEELGSEMRVPFIR
jgi:DNA-binding MarR family transcriptional regulator